AACVARCCAIAALGLACSSSRPSPVVAPNRFEAASISDWIPADVDFLVRIDAARLRRHPLAEAAISPRLLGAAGSGVFRRILPALERAQAIYIGGRVMSDGFQGDGVIAIEDAATGSAEREALAKDGTVRRIALRAANVEAYERVGARRDEPAVELVFDRRGIVLATPAEGDALVRLLRSGPDSDRLEPPARGLVSVAGRPRGGVPAEGRMAWLRPVGEALAKYSASVDAGDAVQMEGELFYEGEEQAERARSALEAALAWAGAAGGPFRSLSDSARLARIGDVLEVRITIPFALIAAVN
ncbi:MAG TPA: hypothetical protein VJT73_11695, partial [Polyangiaceae bacterium]|nr:hypothetical protein [Polyangiaceae bacterium]